ncbi:hypothetical protein T4A_4881 [Trichinella pseudospiralis]|uniref:DUF5641 domain-containing protein n=1 Tax=Trichinella pseudospiralis TaxID=6337 RepID=A0A0V1EZ14_TRIPS|nr:hypothetical protein T4A_4881 [Trichinella pseudospiralis]
MDAQYAEAHRAQVALEDALPDGESLEAALDEWSELCKEVLTTRTKADTFLKEKDTGEAADVKPAPTEKLSPQSSLGKLQPVPLPKFDGDILQFKAFWDHFEVSVDRREDLGAITKLLHLRSCLTGAALKAVEGITVCAENYPEVVRTLHDRFHRVPEVVESHVSSVVGLRGCSEDGTAELTRLHDELNCHFLELRALGKDVDTKLSGFHALLPMIKRKLPPDTLEAWRAFVQDMTDEQITSVAFLSFLLKQTRIKGSARRRSPRKLEQKSTKGERFTTATFKSARDLSTSLCRNGGSVSGNVAYVLGVCRRDTVRGTVSRIPLEPVSILCSPWKTSTAIGDPDEHRGQHLREVQDQRRSRMPQLRRRPRQVHPPRTLNQRMGLRTESRLDSPVGVHCSATVRTSGVLLPVVRAIAYGENGRKRTVNCLLDSGSERSFIRTDIANELGLQGTPSSMTVRGVHGLSATVADSRHLELTALCIPSICDDLVASPTPWPSEIDLPPAAALASPPSPTPIQVLIGFDICRGLRISGEDGPIALETIFGWILCGPKAHCRAGRQETTLFSTATADRPAETTEELNSQMRNFWEIDSIGVTQETAVDPNEETVEKFGQSLLDNHEVALRRLRALRRQLDKSVDTAREYAAVIQTYLDNGWAEQDQSKTKCRVVALQADIEKMYLQIGLRPEDRDVCRFLWQEAGAEAPVVRQHARQCGEIDTLIDRVVTDMYVDDLATSCDDSGEARNLVQKLSDLMRSGGFSLKKWASNDVSALHDLPEEDQSPSGEGRLFELSRCDTKLQLSQTAIPSAWLLGIDWDDCLPADIDVMWRRWKEELDQLPTIRVAVTPREQLQRVELHVFGDASETAYGAVAYLLSTAQGGGAEVKLELMAALLAARLKSYVEKELGIRIERHVCWSDSSIVLSWIQGDPRRWKPFVSNCVQEILRLTEPHQWRHCPTSDNPADKLSRGCALDRLREDRLWWNGPAWLKDSAEQWPSMNIALSPEEAQVTSPERRKIVALCASPQEASLFVIMEPSRYGTMERLIRVTAYCFRFVANVRTRPGERKTETHLSLLELQDAEKRWIASGPVPVRIGDPLAALCPFVDTEGLLRLIVRQAHESELHAGLNQTLAALRRRFWVLDARPFCPMMSDLPPERTTPSFPFNRVGVTPAVHLELVMNMTSISFLAAFRRFIAQRGRPNSFLRTLLHGKYSIDRAPWGGGYWEWMVRSVKNALRKARINDRPLTLLSEDPNDCAPLTPAHFLIGRDLASLSTPAASTPAPTNTSGLRRRWRHQQLLMNHMWKRWVEEYLVTLTSQGKWNKIGRQPEKGDLVFLVEDGVPRNRWKLGVITDPLMGSDGVTRSSVFTAPRLYGPPVSFCLWLERWRTVKMEGSGRSTAFWTVGTPSSMTVRGVHGLSATVADSRHVRFLLGPMHEKVTDSESMKLELTALCIPSICDDLVASPTPWPSEIDLPPAAALASPPMRHPWKNSDNSEVALRRLRALRRRLDKSVDTAREYAAVIQTYLDHGWAEPVEEIGGPPKLGSLATSLLGGPRLSSGQKMHQSLHHLPEARRSPVLSDDERPSA